MRLGAHKFAISHLNDPANHHHIASAFERPALKGAVIGGHVVRLNADRATVRGIVNDEIRVAANGNGAFARKQPKQFGGLR